MLDLLVEQEELLTVPEVLEEAGAEVPMALAELEERAQLLVQILPETVDRVLLTLAQVAAEAVDAILALVLLAWADLEARAES